MNQETFSFDQFFKESKFLFIVKDFLFFNFIFFMILLSILVVPVHESNHLNFLNTH